MNIQRIFQALEEDSSNSALGIITAELEEQDYAVQINGILLNSETIFEGKYSEIERDMKPLRVSLFKQGEMEQEFSIDFIDFHEIIFKK